MYQIRLIRIENRMFLYTRHRPPVANFLQCRPISAKMMVSIDEVIAIIQRVSFSLDHGVQPTIRVIIDYRMTLSSDISIV